MADRSFVDTWQFKDGHLDPNVSSADANKFISAARCILYAAPANKSANADGSPALANFSRIGVVQGYNWSEQKNIEMVYEMGSDVPYILPGRTQGQIQIQKILLSGQDLLNLVYTSDSNGTDVSTSSFLRSLRDINIPLDLLFTFYGQGSDGKYSAAYTRLFKNAWMQGRSESINAGQLMVAENVTIMYEYIANYSFK